MFLPHQVATEIENRTRSGQVFNVFWLTLRDNRDDFAAELAANSSEPLVTHVVRSTAFTNANALMTDVEHVLETTKAQIIRTASIRSQKKVNLVLLSRRDFRIADASSPITLPDWFPVSPGEVCITQVTDLTWNVGVPLSDRAAMQAELRRIIYDVDVALNAALLWSVKRRLRATQRLWNLVFPGTSNGATAITDHLRSAESELLRVKNPSGYRPSAARGQSLVSRLWLKSNGTVPDKLPKLADALMETLPIAEDISFEEPLIAVLNRPTSPIPNLGTRWAFCLLIALRSACQMTTAGAHADDYPSYPVTLLRALSLDILTFLDDAVARVGARD